jgi:hypothetical protein
MAAAIVAVIWTALPSDRRRTETEQPTTKVAATADREQIRGRAAQAPAAVAPLLPVGSTAPTVTSQARARVDGVEHGRATGAFRAPLANEREDRPAERDMAKTFQATAKHQRLTAAAGPPAAAPVEAPPAPMAETVATVEERQKSADAVAQDKDERTRSGARSETTAAAGSSRREAFADSAAVGQQNANAGAAPGAAGGPFNQQPQTISPVAPLSVARADAPLLFQSPDPIVKWRVAGARVERTTDGGRTWTKMLTP